jgi:hypothetical protein
MKYLFNCFLTFFLFSLFITNFASAQQWTDEQKEVWAGVKAYWATFLSNPQEFLNYVDNSYYGWNYESETPHIKPDVQKALNYWTTKGKVAYYSITPSKIWVKDNFAFVHYYYTEVDEGPDNKPVTERGRWTDILMKKDGKWMIIGDHGGKIPK